MSGAHTGPLSQACWFSLLPAGAPPSSRPALPCLWSGPQEGLGLLLSTRTRRENEGAPPTLKEGALKTGLAGNCRDGVWAQKSLYSCPRLWPRLALPPWAEMPGPKVETSPRRARQLMHPEQTGLQTTGAEGG